MKFLSFLLVIKISSVISSPKIIGGRDAKVNEFPYMVSLRRAELELLLGRPYHVCGASILNVDTVITASHCLFDAFGNLLSQPGSYNVVAGSRRLWIQEESTMHFMATEIYNHPSFNFETFENDIAIIKIAPNFDFSLPNIQPISIASTDDLREGILCSVHGWGVTSLTSTLLPDILQTVDVRISNFVQCNESYNGINNQSQFCASEDNRDSCSGDSGGPFVCNNSLVGLVSFGYQCALPNFPGVYAKVSAFQDFINNYKDYSNASSAHFAKYLILVSIITIFSTC